MAPLTTERRAALLAYCKLTEFSEDPEVTALLETLYGAALTARAGSRRSTASGSTPTARRCSPPCS